MRQRRTLARVHAGTVDVVRLGPMLQRAEGFNGVSYTLQTAATL